METLVFIGFALCATATTSLVKQQEWRKEFKVLTAFIVSSAYAALYLFLFCPDTFLEDAASVVFTIFGISTLLYGFFFDRTVFNTYLEHARLFSLFRQHRAHVVIAFAPATANTSINDVHQVELGTASNAADNTASETASNTAGNTASDTASDTAGDTASNTISDTRHAIG